MSSNDTLVIRNGRIIDPSRGVDEVADLTVVDGKIASIGRADENAVLTPSAIDIDARGNIVCPGLIDMHVHLREPGNEDAETIASGCASAVAGGFTSIACMPNTDPAIDTEAMIEFVYRQAARAGLCQVYPIGAITKKREGKELAEIGQMVRAGAVGFSDDGSGVGNPLVLYRAMQYVTMFDKPIIQHCEDPDLAGGGCMNAGVTATRLGLPGIPSIAEDVMVQRDLMVARVTGSRYHVAHVSTAGSVELIREAKRRGIAVTTEVCPHHLLLTEECAETYDTNYKVNPPLRTRADVDACIAGVVDETIDCLVTDHAPHGPEDKECDFQSAPFGLIGLEVAVPLYAKALIEPGHLDWMHLIEKMTIAPARVLGLDRGTLAVGADADITIIDPEMRWIVDETKFHSRSRNCPYGGWSMIGRVTHTIVGGGIKYVLNADNAVPIAGQAD